MTTEPNSNLENDKFSQSVSKLQTFFKTAADWDRAKVSSVRGVYVQKLGGGPRKAFGKTYQAKAALAVELNPAGADGQPSRRRGFYIRSLKDLEALRAAVNNPAIENVIKATVVANGDEEVTADNDSLDI